MSAEIEEKKPSRFRRAVYCALLAIGFLATLAPVGFSGWIREFDQDMRIALPDLTLSLFVFYTVLVAALIICALQKSQRRFWIFFAVIGAFLLSNLSGCFIIVSHM